LHKLLDGVDGISGMLVAKGLPGLSPTVCWWGKWSPPACYSRHPDPPGGAGAGFTMVVAWLMVGLGKTFALDAVGRGRLRTWSISLLARWRLRYWGRALFAGGSRPGGKNASLSWGVKSILLRFATFSVKAYLMSPERLLSPGIFPEAACASPGYRTAL
jgi:putative oxidoreductase